jgi:CTP:molybdopterin cytidylyltransferase MocA
LRGKPVYQHALAAVLASEVDVVIVVTGALQLSLPDSVVEVANPHWSQGQATSVQAGVYMAATLGVGTVVIGLADQPFVTTATWNALTRSRCPIAVATYEGARRNPVRLEASVWPLLPVTGDEGARTLMRLRASLVCEIPCDGSAADIDTLEDLKTWNS